MNKFMNSNPRLPKIGPHVYTDEKAHTSVLLYARASKANKTTKHKKRIKRRKKNEKKTHPMTWISVSGANRAKSHRPLPSQITPLSQRSGKVRNRSCFTRLMADTARSSCAKSVMSKSHTTLGVCVYRLNEKGGCDAGAGGEEHVWGRVEFEIPFGSYKCTIYLNIPTCHFCCCNILLYRRR